MPFKILFWGKAICMDVQDLKSENYETALREIKTNGRCTHG